MLSFTILLVIILQLFQVAQQCKENRFAIKTLETFQHIEDNKDKGQRVRDTATQLVALLDDDERLKTERTRAIKAKERSAQKISCFGSDGNVRNYLLIFFTKTLVVVVLIFFNFVFTQYI